MVTKRTPVKRDSRHKITPRAIELFEKWRRARSESAYTAAQSDLIDELALQPWESMLLDDPDEENPYPAGSVAAAHWAARAARPESGTLFRKLAEAAAAARKQGAVADR
jgi:hypothetical protein